MRAPLLCGLLACALLAGAPACSDDADTSTTGSNTGGGGTTGGGGDAGTGGSGGGGSAGTCSEPAEVPCSDQVIQQLDLQPIPAPGLITSQADGAGWMSQVDATAGGFGADPPHAYVYGRFTDSGLEKVEISDEQALESMDWDIAFRRFIVRVNSGNSGPSCVVATPIPGSPAYDDVTAMPENLPMYRKDEYFTAGCTMIDDGSGLGSPATALSTYWEYPGCVSMTDNVFIVQTQSGQRLKLTVTDYYTPEVQEQCDTTGSVPMSGSGAGSFRIRWAFLP
jgi:hypothetical protein